MITTEMAPKRYSLFTTICLMIGICIGSGIFFKSDNVLIATGGNVWLGVILFVITAVYIVFGGLTLSYFAQKTDKAGGLIDYASVFCSKRFAHTMGMFYTFIYFPSITAIIFWVIGIYSCIVFGIENNLNHQMAIGLCVMVVTFVFNALLPRISGWFQNISTLTKILPIVAIGALGTWSIASGNAQTAIPSDGFLATSVGFSWLTAAGPVAYSYDGWTVTTSIAPEVKNAKKNLPLALIFAPLIILVLYLTYFVGISLALGPETVMKAGDQSLSLIFVRFFGPQAAAYPTLLALLAIFATGNGLLLSFIRMPQALAIRNDLTIPQLAKLNNRTKMPLYSAWFALVLTLLWSLVHFYTQNYDLIPNGDVSEITISISMLMMLPYFFAALKLWKQKEISVLRGLIAPLFAIVGCVTIGCSGLLDPTRWPFALAYCLAILAIYVRFTKHHRAVPKSS